jgi:hypothetical protein
MKGMMNMKEEEEEDDDDDDDEDDEDEDDEKMRIAVVSKKKQGDVESRTSENGRKRCYFSIGVHTMTTRSSDVRDYVLCRTGTYRVYHVE